MKSHRRAFAKRFAISAGVLAASLASTLICSDPARADSWIFQPSYYTEPGQPNVLIGPARYLVLGGPFYTPPQGAYVRTGFRNQINTIQVGNATYDQTNIWDSWIQIGTQY